MTAAQLRALDALDVDAAKVSNRTGVDLAGVFVQRTVAGQLRKQRYARRSRSWRDIEITDRGRVARAVAHVLEDA